MENLIKLENLQENYPELVEIYLSQRISDNPEFKKKFIKTFGDLIFSQNEEMLEKLKKSNPNSLMNAVFKATEIGASFAKKEISFIPYAIFKNVNEGGIEKKKATGFFDAVVIVDINFQKQQILKLTNCKKFFTAQIKEGVEVIQDLTSGKFIFDGKNDVTKSTIGYYAVFITTDNEVYDIFMTNAEIINRAKFSPQFSDKNYKIFENNIHMEKIVVRNLLKIIPKISNDLSNILAYDEDSDFTPFEEVKEVKELKDGKKTDKLEEAKKELAKQKNDNSKSDKNEEIVKDDNEIKVF